METVLYGERAFFAEGHFPDFAVENLTSTIQRLGGQVVAERNDSTLLIVNPSSLLHTKELENLSFLSKNYPDVPQTTLIPYHYLSICALRSTRVPLPDLSPATPYFVHPDASRDHAPLGAWVSVNIHRHEGESAEAARINVISLLESGGAISVSKRAHADLLVVDTTSQFYKTVKAEKEKFGRDWQKLAERDWVEACVQEKRLMWRSIKEEAENGEESFEDEPVGTGKGKGTGRPTGTPRVEYTPQDDDFLCRYLAAFHPDGSWHSRKTYHLLAGMTAEYPIADRHTGQSWHERFKKNSAPFTRRIQKLVREGVDKTLKTEKERAKAAQIQAARGEPVSSEAALPALRDGHTTAEMEGARLTEVALQALQEPPRGLSIQLQAQEAPPVQAVSLDVSIVELETAAVTGKRKLVDSDSDHDPAPIQAARSKGKGRAQDLSDKLPPNGVAAESQAEPAFQSPLPRLEADDAAVDRASASLEESQNTISSNGHDPRLVGAKTQAVLEAFAHARPAVSHGSPGMRRARVRMSEQPVASRSYTEARSPQIQQRSPYVRSPVRPATELIRTRHSMPPQAIDRPPGQSGTTRMSIPLRLDFDFRGVTAGEGQTRYETPSPGRNRSLLRDEIVSSASKRRRALERAAQRGARSSPDKVYVSTAIPAARSTPDPGIRPHRGRSLSPPLSPAQKTERILAGQELIRAVKDQYRARISGLSEKYGVRPTELFRVVNEMPKSRGGAGSQVYWLDVEEGLRRHFGF